jgi:hypothetical protein
MADVLQSQQTHDVEILFRQPSPIAATYEYQEEDSQATTRSQTFQHTSSRADATAAPLLNPENVAIRLESWPTTPKAVQSPL